MFKRFILFLFVICMLLSISAVYLTINNIDNNNSLSDPSSKHLDHIVNSNQDDQENNNESDDEQQDFEPRSPLHSTDDIRPHQISHEESDEQESLNPALYDINNDGSIDEKDACVIRCFYGCDVETSCFICALCDVNNDGVVNPVDVGVVKTHYGLTVEGSRPTQFISQMNSITNPYDINFDGSVDEKDVCLIRCFMGFNSNSLTDICLQCDYDDNQIINPVDVSYIKTNYGS